MGPFPDLSGRWGCHVGKLVFAQVMEFAPWHTLADWSQVSGRLPRTHLQLPRPVPVHAFAQLTYRRACRTSKLAWEHSRPSFYHLVSAATSVEQLGRCQRDAGLRIHCEFAQALIRVARRLYAEDPLAVDLDKRLCLGFHHQSICVCRCFLGPFRHQAAIKLQRCWTCARHSGVHLISGRQLHDVNVLDDLVAGAGGFYVMDRGYLDFERLYPCTKRAPSRHAGQVELHCKRRVLPPGRSQHRGDLRFSTSN